MMELNENVLQVLKNFAGINSNIVINEGSEIRTMSEARNILASAKINQSFPKTFGIYDLNELLNVLSLVDSPRLRFEDRNMLIGDSSGRSTVKYFFTDTDMLTQPPSTFNMPEAEIKLEISNDVLNKIKRAASALGHSELAITPNDGSISLTVRDSENPTSNTFTIDVPGAYGNANFCFICKISALRLLPGDYNVQISSKNISHFTNKEGNVEYYIALEKNSEYGE